MQSPNRTNLLLTRFGVLVTDFGDLSPVCQANYPWLVAAYRLFVGWLCVGDNHLSLVGGEGTEPEISPYRWGEAAVVYRKTVYASMKQSCSQQRRRGWLETPKAGRSLAPPICVKKMNWTVTKARIPTNSDYLLCSGLLKQ